MKNITKEYIFNQIDKNRKKISDFGIAKIGLFGSYLKNQQTPESDIDILIDFYPDKEIFDNFMDICFMLDEIFKGYKVEVVTKNGLSPYIGPKILNKVQYV